VENETDYTACLKNAVTLVIAKMCKINSMGLFFTCVRLCWHGSFQC